MNFTKYKLIVRNSISRHTWSAIMFILITTIGCGQKQKKNNTNYSDKSEYSASYKNGTKNKFIAIDSTLTETQIDTLDLGRIKQGEIVIGEFELSNLSHQPQSIVKIDAECGCTAVKYSKKPIMPQQSTNVTVEFDSKSKFNTQLKSINIRLEPAKISKKVIIKAEVIV